MLRASRKAKMEIPDDLSVGDTGVKPELSKASAHIVRDDEGNIVSREFGSRRDAEKFGEHLIEEGKAKRFEITALPPPAIDLRGLGITLELGPDIKRLALKMCVAVCTLLPAFHHAEVEHARLFLTGARREGAIDIVLPAYPDHKTLDSRRQPLSHLIYVERARERVYGVVQFFGVVQMFCRLGLPLADRPEAALLSSLDPVTREESHSEIEPLQLTEPPFAIWIGDYPRMMQMWLDKFRQEAVKRGATHPPDLKMKRIDIDKGSAV